MKKTYDVNHLYVEKRLVDWASWIFRIQNGGEGWPKVSLLAIMLEVGAIIKSPVKASPFAYNRAEEVDCWVKRMGQQKPHYEAVIRIYYIRDQNLKLKDAIKKSGIARQTFYDNLVDAKTWLANKLHDSHDGRLLNPYFLD